MKRILFLFVFGFSGFALSGQAINNSRKTRTEIIPGKQATHIAGIIKDTLFISTGTSFRFTVDTPEDQGLVSTQTNVKDLLLQVQSKDGSVQQYQIMDKTGTEKKEGNIVTGDRLIVISQDGTLHQTYQIAVKPMALSGFLSLQLKAITANVPTDITLYFTAGQRSPDASVQFFIPADIQVTMDNTTVNVIGRGDVKLSGLSKQSIGRTGTHYSYSRVGDATITKSANGSTLLSFHHLDLRPANGVDLKITIANVQLSKTGNYIFKAAYQTTQPETLTSPGIGTEMATLKVLNTVADLEKIVDKNIQYKETLDTYTKLALRWGLKNALGAQLLKSLDEGKSWENANAVIDEKKSVATIAGLQPDKWYRFKLLIKEGNAKGVSNIVSFYSGKLDIKSLGGINADGKEDNTESINRAITMLGESGGGTLWFTEGIYNVRTIHLASNVYLYIGKGAILQAIKGGDAPETTWFSDKKYRSGLSPTDPGPYLEPENWLTKQDVGHHYFKNSMFFGERLDNVKIIGNGLITGNGNVVTGDNVMKNAPDNRTDKLITCKLCTNLEIGGIQRKEDLWYDSTKDEPYYIGKGGEKITDLDNMLQIDRSGHFALLSTGTDHINVHDTYFGKNNQSTVRDIYDFMGSCHVTVTNIYCKVSSDDIIKPGSDCSLGFTRPARNYKVRNIIGDTNCNLFQIGSETADDIMEICVDNIYVLGANKAGFSISTNDGAHIKDIHLNCGETGPLHSRSKMYRATAPFFISISNRGRIIGADVGKYAFTENGVKHDELLVKNVNIGEVENISLNGIDVSEVYSGSSFSSKTRWKPYDGTQKRASSIIAGYALPDASVVNGGLDFTLPNGKHTGYIKNVSFKDVHILDKGGNPLTDTAAMPPELGVGQYNVSNLKIQPAYGLWARHVAGLEVEDCSFNYEKKDGRYVFFLDDVVGAHISSVKTVVAEENGSVVKRRHASNVVLENISYYKSVWGNQPVMLTDSIRSEKK
ncbi:MAG: endopygalactorunase [Bacteroidota bacterium]